MPTDGLIKALLKQKCASFVHQLGLVDISNLLKNLKYDFGKDMNVFFPIFSLTASIGLASHNFHFISSCSPCYLRGVLQFVPHNKLLVALLF